MMKRFQNEFMHRQQIDYAVRESALEDVIALPCVSLAFSTYALGITAHVKNFTSKSFAAQHCLIKQDMGSGEFWFQ